MNATQLKFTFGPCQADLDFVQRIINGGGREGGQRRAYAIQDVDYWLKTGLAPACSIMYHAVHPNVPPYGHDNVPSAPATIAARRRIAASRQRSKSV